MVHYFLASRLLLAILFLQSGWHKIFDFEKNAQIMAGWYARWAALALFCWMITVTLLFHAFRAAEPAQVFNQTNHLVS